MTKKLIRRLVPVMAVSCALAMATGCGGGAEETKAAANNEATETEAAKETENASGAVSETSAKDTLIIATANETPSVTTVDHNAVAGDYLNAMTHSTLFTQDNDLNIIPDVCEEYSVDETGCVWTFKIKEGVKFHNGDEMKAEDVVASIELSKISPNVNLYSSYMEPAVVDDYTLTITTPEPNSGLLSDLGHHGNAILPKKLIESGHDFNKEPIGSGPYVLKEWAKGESLTFEAFPDYFGGEAPIKTVIWKVIPEGSSRTMALETGEVDLIVEVETTDIPRMSEASNITVFDEPGTSHNFMMINNEKAPFDNINFRRAMNAAIDKAAIVQVALNGNGSVCDAMVPTAFPGATAEGAPTFDVEAAKAYMAESGLDPADCGFALICSDDTKLRAGQVIQSSLKDNLGVEITLESMDLATYLDVTASGDYEAAIGGYTSSSMLGYVQGVYHSSSINASNKTRTNVPEIDALIDKVKTTVDMEENVKVVEELSKALNENCPQVPLYMRNNTRAYNSKITGFNCTPSGGTEYHYFSFAE